MARKRSLFAALFSSGKALAQRTVRQAAVHPLRARSRDGRARVHHSSPHQPLTSALGYYLSLNFSEVARLLAGAAAASLCSVTVLQQNRNAALLILGWQIS